MPADGEPTSTFAEIVVGFDDSERGLDALRLGELLARTTEARLVVVRVHRLLHERDRDTAAEDLGAEIQGLLASSPVAAEPLTLIGASPARALHELAESDRVVDAIALGSTHRAGLGRVLPGSVADRLLSGAPCPVAVAPRGYGATRADGSLTPADELRVIGVGFDGSVESVAALDAAAALGRAAEATLRVIAVEHPPVAVPPPAAGTAASAPPEHDLQSELHAAVSRLPSELRALPVFEHGSPGRRLTARAEEGVDLLVVGSRGYGPLRAVLIGSVAASVLAGAPCPVLVTPRSAVAATA